jgi:hypothetical protein
LPRSAERRLVWLLGIALFAFYLLVLGGHHYSIDGILTFQAAKQLFFHHTLVLDPPVRWGDDIRHISTHRIGLALAYLPLLAVWSPLFYRWPALRDIPHNPALAYNPALYSNLPYLLCSWLNALFTAATACLVFRLARLVGLSPRWSVAATLAYALASPAMAYARYDFPQPLAGLLLTLAVWSLLRAGGTGSPRSLYAGGGALAFAVLTRPEFVVLAAWIIAWTGITARALGLRAALTRAAVVASPPALAGLIYLGINRLEYGDVTKTGTLELSVLFPGSLVGTLTGLLGLLVSPMCGLLVFFPLAWLSLPGLIRLAREARPAGPLFTGLIAVVLAVYGSLSIWWAGWSWGPRFLVPVLPLLTIASTVWAARSSANGRAGPRLAFLALGALGALIAANAVLFDFVSQFIWVQQTLGLPDNAAAQFRTRASPLVSGWGPPFDLLPARLWRAGQMRAFVVCALIDLTLIATLVWAGRRIRDTLGEWLRLTSVHSMSSGR